MKFPVGVPLYSNASSTYWHVSSHRTLRFYTSQSSHDVHDPSTFRLAAELIDADRDTLSFGYQSYMSPFYRRCQNFATRVVKSYTSVNATSHDRKSISWAVHGCSFSRRRMCEPRSLAFLGFAFPPRPCHLTLACWHPRG